jgi:hypothetical protein
LKKGRNIVNNIENKMATIICIRDNEEVKDIREMRGVIIRKDMIDEVLKEMKIRVIYIRREEKEEIRRKIGRKKIEIREIEEIKEKKIEEKEEKEEDRMMKVRCRTEEIRKIRDYYIEYGEIGRVSEELGYRREEVKRVLETYYKGMYEEDERILRSGKRMRRN